MLRIPSLAVAGTLLLARSASAHNAASPLPPLAWAPLPHGTVRPEGWLQRQLRVQGDGALTLHHVWGGTAERQVPVIVSADPQQQAYCKDMLPGVFHFLVP